MSYSPIKSESDRIKLLIFGSEINIRPEIAKLARSLGIEVTFCLEEKYEYEKIILDVPNSLAKYSALKPRFQGANVLSTIVKSSATDSFIFTQAKKVSEKEQSPLLIWIRILGDDEEFILLLRSLLRKVRPAIFTERLSYGAFQLDQANFALFYENTKVNLTKLDICLLAPFFDAPHKKFERSFLRKLVFDFQNWEQDSRNLDFALARMRRNIQITIKKDPIRSIRGIGYELRKE